MARVMEHQAHSWNIHIMGPSSGSDPFIRFEDNESEEAAISGALRALVDGNLLSATTYDVDAYSRFCSAVKDCFDIPWTGISPRMRRMIYSINALHQPQHLVCAGIFCGYTFICNAGASIGPGASYKSEHLFGLEILQAEAARAKNNINKFSPGYEESVICADAAEWLLEEHVDTIDLLYIDAKSIDFDPKAPAATKLSTYKSEYLKIIEAALPRLHRGSLVLAHNSVNAASEISDYLTFVRGARFQTSMNLIIDDAGLEVSVY